MGNHPSIEGNGVVLRPTSDVELPSLRRLFTDPGFYEHWDGNAKSDDEILAKFTGARSPEVECFIIEAAGTDVGFVQYHVSDQTGGGMDMVLLPEARGRGIGSAVVQALAAFVHTALGWQYLSVDPDVSNTRGVNFWRNVGFEPEGIVKDEDGRDPFWQMRRTHHDTP